MDHAVSINFKKDGPIGIEFLLPSEDKQDFIDFQADKEFLDFLGNNYPDYDWHSSKNFRFAYKDREEDVPYFSTEYTGTKK